MQSQKQRKKDFQKWKKQNIIKFQLEIWYDQKSQEIMLKEVNRIYDLSDSSKGVN